jgi:glycerate dehydrogenase
MLGSRRPTISFARRFFTSTSIKHRNETSALFLNAARLDYDQQLDFSSWHSICKNVILNRVDAIRDSDEMLQLLHQHQPTIVLAKEMAIPATVVEQFPSSVQLICEAGTGYNNWPIAVARSKGIPVCNVPTYSTDAVAHMAITYLMNFAVSMFDQQRMLQNNDRSNFTGPFTLPLHEVGHQTLGLVGGAGRIGTKVAEIALALGMKKVIISSRQPTLPSEHILHNHPNVECTTDVNYLLRNSDYVSLHTPLNDQTRRSFGRQQIEQMKPTAFLINTSRGGVCHEEELIQCLEERVIQAAGLDVTTTEPPPPDSKLWQLSNVWMSPHTGWRRLETRQRLVDMTAENMKAFVQAKSESEYINVVN